MKRFYTSYLILVCLLALIQPTSCLGSASSPYFQQEVRYTIHVRLDDTLHLLRGDWEMTYINHSKDALREIRIHLWPNAYSSNTTALAKQLLRDGDTEMYYMKPDKPAGKIDSLTFSVAGKVLETRMHKEHPDICSILLDTPLEPGDSITISSPFRVAIPPGSISRLGHIGQAYAITQWYPKPAVYDQDGWHEMPYLNQGEFYSEYGSYDVHITVPANYVIGATGDMQNPEELSWLEQKAQEPLRTEKDMRFPESDTRYKTLRFTQRNVHDFAWFADKRFQVRKGEVALPYSGRKVTTWAMFTQKEARLWERAIEYINDAVYHYSKWVGEYPYSQCTAVDGTISAGGGMEYPNVTIIGSSGSAFPLEVVIAHEVGHNWFYGLLGSNEREHPWMDEGINSYYEMRYVLEKYPPQKFGNLNELSSSPNAAATVLGLNRLDYRQTSRFSYLMSGAAFTEQAIGLPADQFTGMNYGTVVYKKTAVAMDYLAQVLGQDLFDSCMHAYFRAWVYRHPGPNDIRTVFESVSGRNLGWFFDGLIHAEEGSDPCLHHVRFDKDQVRFEVTEKGPVPLPVEVTGYRGDSAVTRLWVEPWKTGFSIPCTGCDRIEIDADRRSLDVNPNNNSSRWTAPHLSFFPGIRDPKRNTLAITPVMGWNATDRWMPGLNITNLGIPNQPLEFSLTPLYSISTGRFNG
ncbi:MAG: M1 family metallopeptidase, partial [Bacteroidota bacterium]